MQLTKEIIAQAGSMLGLAFLGAITVYSLNSISRHRLTDAEITRLSLLENQKKLFANRERFGARSAQHTIDFTALTWNSSGPDTELQREIVSAAQLSEVILLSFGPSKAPQEFNGNTFGVDIELNATNLRFLDFLHHLEEFSPPISVGSLVVRQGVGKDDRTSETLIDVRMTVWGIVNENISDASTKN